VLALQRAPGLAWDHQLSVLEEARKEGAALVYLNYRLALQACGR
jgi:hypothetical protein